MMRGLTGYSDRPGVVIDQRFNGGGITPDFLIEWLRRKPVYYYMFREGDDIATPTNPGPNTKVLVVNENNGSAAETFAFMYKLARVGPIVGTRTAGAGIGPYSFTPACGRRNIQLPNPPLQTDAPPSASRTSAAPDTSRITPTTSCGQRPPTRRAVQAPPKSPKTASSPPNARYPSTIVRPTRATTHRARSLCRPILYALSCAGFVKPYEEG